MKKMKKTNSMKSNDIRGQLKSTIAKLILMMSVILFIFLKNEPLAVEQDPSYDKIVFFVDVSGSMKTSNYDKSVKEILEMFIAINPFFQSETKIEIYTFNDVIKNIEYSDKNGLDEIFLDCYSHYGGDTNIKIVFEKINEIMEENNSNERLHFVLISDIQDTINDFDSIVNVINEMEKLQLYIIDFNSENSDRKTKTLDSVVEKYNIHYSVGNTNRDKIFELFANIINCEEVGDINEEKQYLYITYCESKNKLSKGDIVAIYEGNNAINGNYEYIILHDEKFNEDTFLSEALFKNQKVFILPKVVFSYNKEKNNQLELVFSLESKDSGKGQFWLSNNKKLNIVSSLSYQLFTDEDNSKILVSEGIINPLNDNKVVIPQDKCNVKTYEINYKTQTLIKEESQNMSVKLICDDIKKFELERIEPYVNRKKMKEVENQIVGNEISTIDLKPLVVNEEDSEILFSFSESEILKNNPELYNEFGINARITEDNKLQLSIDNKHRRNFVNNKNKIRVFFKDKYSKPVNLEFNILVEEKSDVKYIYAIVAAVVLFTFMIFIYWKVKR